MIGHCFSQLCCSLGHGKKRDLPWAFPTCALLLRAALAMAQDCGTAKLRYGWDLKEGPDQRTGKGQARPQAHMTPFPADEFYNETQAKIFLQFYEQTSRIVFNDFMEATWNYVTNITKRNRKNMVQYHLPSRSSLPLIFLGILGVGDHSSCPVSIICGKRDTPKHTSKWIASSRPFRGLEFSLHNNFWIICPCKFYLFPFKDFSILSLLANLQ